MPNFYFLILRGTIFRMVIDAHGGDLFDNTGDAHSTVFVSKVYQVTSSPLPMLRV